MKLFSSLLCTCTIAVSAYALIDTSNLNNCINEAKQNIALPLAQQPLFTTNYQSLMMNLQAQTVRGSLPVLYQQSMLDPFITYLQSLGAAGFNSIFLGMQLNPNQQFLKDFLPDIAEALLQSGHLAITKPTNAFQEVVSDLYEGFISEESRRGDGTGMPIKPPERGVIPPLVKWGNPESGPYTWPADATMGIKLGAAVVSLPPNNLKGGLLAWNTLPHETAGHDILHADIGLLQELGNIVYNAVVTQLSNVFLANYWKSCIDETASDVVGTLHCGPMTGMGLIGYFRALMGGKLRSVGYMPPTDTHPIDILRGYIAARVVAQMPFAGALEWSNAIRAEVDKDLQTIAVIVPQTRQQIPLGQQVAIRSAEIVADAIMNSKLSTLEGHSLKDIRIWGEEDQAISEAIGTMMKNGSPLAPEYRNSGYMAAHVVAGATIEALKANGNIPGLFNSMIDYLDIMNQNNKIWATGSAAPTPTPVPVPPPGPGPVPAPDDFNCLWQCFQQCKNRVPNAPQLSTQAMEIALSEEMAMGQ